MRISLFYLLMGYKMKVLSSLKSAKQRAGCQVVKRKGRVFVICKENPRFKAVQV